MDEKIGTRIYTNTQMSEGEDESLSVDLVHFLAVSGGPGPRVSCFRWTSSMCWLFLVDLIPVLAVSDGPGPRVSCFRWTWTTCQLFPVTWTTCELYQLNISQG